MSKIKLTKSDILVFYVYLLFQITHILYNVTVLTPYMKIFRILVYVFFMVIIFLNAKKYKIKEIFIMGILTLLIGVSTYITDKENLLIVMLFIISFKSIDFEKVIKYDIAVKIILITILLILYELGFTTEYVTYRADGTVRSTLGFTHPNVLGIYILSLCADVFYLNYSKKTLLFPIFSGISIIIVNNVSNSRTSTMCMVLLLVLWFFSLRKNNKKQIKSKLLKYSIFIFTGITYVFVCIYRMKSSFSFLLNKIFSGRLSYINNFLSEYTIKLFGNKVNFISTQQATGSVVQAWVLDNAYFYLLIVNGIICFIIVAIAYYLFLKKLTIENDKRLICIYIVYLFLGLTESNVFDITYNIFLICLGELVFKEYSKKYINNKGSESDDKEIIK